MVKSKVGWQIANIASLDLQWSVIIERSHKTKIKIKKAIQ